MDALKPDLGIVVNYFTNYSNEQTRQLLVTSTSLSLRYLRLSPRINTILLVDGSETPDPDMKQACDTIGVSYYHHGKRISYVDAYNIGWKMLDEPYIGLMANDIIPFPIKTIDLLADWVAKPDVGCTFPYFATHRDNMDETQRLGFLHRGRITCEPSSCTLNLNLFKRHILEEIGGLDPNYLYGFQEPILMLKIRKLGYRVVMVGNAVVYHCDRMTKDLGESKLVESMHEVDIERWSREYPEYATKRGIAWINVSRYPLSTKPVASFLWKLASKIPHAKASLAARALLLWLEPHLTHYPASKGICR